MVKMKLVSRGGYSSIDDSKLPAVVGVVEVRDLPCGDKLYMVDGDFIPCALPESMSPFAGDAIPFYSGEVIPL